MGKKGSPGIGSKIGEISSKLKNFYKVTAKFLLDKKSINRLIKTGNYDELIKMLKNIENRMKGENDE